MGDWLDDMFEGRERAAEDIRQRRAQRDTELATLEELAPDFRKQQVFLPLKKILERFNAKAAELERLVIETSDDQLKATRQYYPAAHFEAKFNPKTFSLTWISSVGDKDKTTRRLKINVTASDQLYLTDEGGIQITNDRLTHEILHKFLESLLSTTDLPAIAL